MCLSFLGEFCACKKGNNTFNFAKFAQEERISYVKEYLMKEYGISAEISEVKKRQINSFSSEEMYYAIARCEDESRIYCWINDNGQIFDSKFLVDLEEDINQLFVNIISKKIENFSALCRCTLNSPTEKVWTSENIEQMLIEEDISVSIRIFVTETEKDIVERLVDNSFDGAFSFASGACYIYFVNDIKSIEDNNIDLTKYGLFFKLEEE